jgi:hypothetical protein
VQLGTEGRLQAELAGVLGENAHDELAAMAGYG